MVQGAKLARMGWCFLDVVGEYQPGVVRLSTNAVDAPLITTKPGSYPWPDTIVEQWSEGVTYVA